MGDLAQLPLTVTAELMLTMIKEISMRADEKRRQKALEQAKEGEMKVKNYDDSKSLSDIEDESLLNLDEKLKERYSPEMSDDDLRAALMKDAKNDNFPFLMTPYFDAEKKGYVLERLMDEDVKEFRIVEQTDGSAWVLAPREHADKVSEIVMEANRKDIEVGFINKRDTETLEKTFGGQRVFEVPELSALEALRLNRVLQYEAKRQFETQGRALKDREGFVIPYTMFVTEVNEAGMPSKYSVMVREKDRDTLMKALFQTELELSDDDARTVIIEQELRSKILNEELKETINEERPFIAFDIRFPGRAIEVKGDEIIVHQDIGKDLEIEELEKTDPELAKKRIEEEGIVPPEKIKIENAAELEPAQLKDEIRDLVNKKVKENDMVIALSANSPDKFVQTEYQTRDSLYPQIECASNEIHSFTHKNFEKTVKVSIETSEPSPDGSMNLNISAQMNPGAPAQIETVVPTVENVADLETKYKNDKAEGLINKYNLDVNDAFEGKTTQEAIANYLSQRLYIAKEFTLEAVLAKDANMDMVRDDVQGFAKENPVTDKREDKEEGSLFGELTHDGE